MSYKQAYKRILGKRLGHIEWDKLKNAYSDWKRSGEYAALEALDAYANDQGPADPLSLARRGMSLDAFEHYGVPQQRLYVDTLLRYHQMVERCLARRRRLYAMIVLVAGILGIVGMWLL